jgi:DNA-binding protein H-NS
MKTIEIMGHILVPLTNEETELYQRIGTFENGVTRQELTEREVYLANQLVNKNALYRLNRDGSIKYYKQKNSGTGS